MPGNLIEIFPVLNVYVSYGTAESTWNSPTAAPPDSKRSGEHNRLFFFFCRAVDGKQHPSLLLQSPNRPPSPAPVNRRTNRYTCLTPPPQFSLAHFHHAPTTRPTPRAHPHRSNKTQEQPADVDIGTRAGHSRSLSLTAVTSDHSRAIPGHGVDSAPDTSTRTLVRRGSAPAAAAVAAAEDLSARIHARRSLPASLDPMGAEGFAAVDGRYDQRRAAAAAASAAGAAAASVAAAAAAATGRGRGVDLLRYGGSSSALPPLSPPGVDAKLPTGVHMGVGRSVGGVSGGGGGGGGGQSAATTFKEDPRRNRVRAGLSVALRRTESIGVRGDVVESGGSFAQAGAPVSSFDSSVILVAATISPCLYKERAEKRGTPVPCWSSFSLALQPCLTLASGRQSPCRLARCRGRGTTRIPRTTRRR